MKTSEAPTTVTTDVGASTSTLITTVRQHLFGDLVLLPYPATRPAVVPASHVRHDSNRC
jgi:hypothetical protein